LTGELVIDASACVPLLIAGRLPDELAGQTIVGPPLLWSEATSALNELVWRGILADGEARVALQRFNELTIEPRQPSTLYEDALVIARSLGWAKTYDAEYVALAQILGASLLTLDARLRRGADRLVTFYSLQE
jgi:predicted nucleic acid-binding protein